MLFRSGVNRVVPDAGHDLPTEHPEAVIAAVNEVLAAVGVR